MKQPEVRQPTLWQRAAQWLREQAKVEIILPVVIGCGLLAYVSSVAVAPRSGGQLWVVIQHTWLLILLLTLPYLACRALVWRELLCQVGLAVPWRQLSVAFAGGELTKSLPAGVYTQNYLLARLEHFGPRSLARSSTATTAMLGLETFVAVPIVLIIGIPGAPWLFWTLVGVVVSWILVLTIAWFLVRFWASRLAPEEHRWLGRGLQLAKEFLEAAPDLVARRTLLSLIPAAIYMLIYVVDLFAITRAVGVHSLSFAHTMAVYGVVVLAVILIPIPTELGITEFTGLGALAAYGVPASTAAIIMLSLRLLATGMTIVVAGLLLLFLRGEFAQAKRASRPDIQSGEAVAGS